MSDIAGTDIDSVSRFPGAILKSLSSANPRRRLIVNEETRKLAITVSAAIFAARALTDWDGKRSPRLVASVSDAVEKAKLLVSTLEANY